MHNMILWNLFSKLDLHLSDSLVFSNVYREINIVVKYYYTNTYNIILKKAYLPLESTKNNTTISYNNFIASKRRMK